MFNPSKHSGGSSDHDAWPELPPLVFPRKLPTHAGGLLATEAQWGHHQLLSRPVRMLSSAEGRWSHGAVELDSALGLTSVTLQAALWPDDPGATVVRYGKVPDPHGTPLNMALSEGPNPELCLSRFDAQSGVEPTGLHALTGCTQMLAHLLGDFRIRAGHALVIDHAVREMISSGGDPAFKRLFSAQLRASAGQRGPWDLPEEWCDAAGRPLEPHWIQSLEQSGFWKIWSSPEEATRALSGGEGIQDVEDSEASVVVRQHWLSVQGAGFPGQVMVGSLEQARRWITARQITELAGETCGAEDSSAKGSSATHLLIETMAAIVPLLQETHMIHPLASSEDAFWEQAQETMMSVVALANEHQDST